MKLLYITNGINGSGGLERVLAVKASYLADTFGYEVHILTLNGGDKNPFYQFSASIYYHDIKVGGNPFNYLLSYRKGIKKILQKLNPTVISVCDDGLKGMLFPVFFGTKTPVIYERHVSKQVELKSDQLSLMEQLKSKITFFLMAFGGKRFHKFVVLTNGNVSEWNFQNITVISNPLPFATEENSPQTSNKVIAVGKQSYQKGYDRLLEIWSEVQKKHPNWVLEVYGKFEPDLQLEQRAKELNIASSVFFYPPTKAIEAKYKEACIYVMTSRYEGFGMVLIEAMAFGVPCISFDCPHGPADIIENEVDGLLIENGNIAAFVKGLNQLMDNKAMRVAYGKKAQQHVQRFGVQEIASQWDKLFNSLIDK